MLRCALLVVSLPCRARAALGGAEPRMLAAFVHAVVCDHVLTAQQLDALLAGAHSLQP